MSKQLEDKEQLLPTSAPLDDNGLAGDPEWVGNFDATLETGPFEFYYGLRYVGETSNVERFGSQAQTYQFENVHYVLRPTLWSTTTSRFRWSRMRAFTCASASPTCSTRSRH